MNLDDNCLLDELDNLISIADIVTPCFPWNKDNDPKTDAEYRDLISSIGRGAEDFKKNYEGTFAIDSGAATDATNISISNITKPAYAVTATDLIATNSYADSQISISSIADEISKKVAEDMAKRLDTSMFYTAPIPSHSHGTYNSTAYGYPSNHSMNGVYVSGIPSHSHSIDIPAMEAARRSQYGTIALEPAKDDINIRTGNIEVKICASGDVEINGGNITDGARAFWKSVSTYAPNNVAAITKLENVLEEQSSEIVALKAELDKVKMDAIPLLSPYSYDDMHQDINKAFAVPESLLHDNSSARIDVPNGLLNQMRRRAGKPEVEKTKTNFEHAMELVE